MCKAVFSTCWELLLACCLNIYSLRLSLTKKNHSSHCLNDFFTFFLPALLLLAINPCQDGTHGCHSNADCLYLRPGRNNCTCAAGYTGDGTVCIGMLMFKMDCAYKLFKTIVQCSYSSIMFGSLFNVLTLLFSLFIKLARVNFFP